MRTMRRCRRLRVPFLVLMSSLMVGACTGGPTQSPSSVIPTPAVNATVAQGLPTTVDALPPTDVAGFHALMDRLKGTPVVVNIWANWCGPCEAEAPLLSAAARAHPGVQFLGVDIKDSRDDALGFLTKYDVTYPSLFDAAGAIQRDLGAFGQPDTYFYDATGARVDLVIGALTQASLDAGLGKIAPA